MVLDDCIVQDDGLSHANARSDDGFRADGDVGSQLNNSFELKSVKSDQKSSVSHRRCRMNTGRWVNVNIADDFADFGRAVVDVLVGVPVQLEEMPVRVDGRSGGFDLRPPVGHRQSEELPRSSEQRQNFALPFDVSLVAIVPVSVPVEAHGVAGVKNGRDSGENVQRGDVNAAVYVRRHVGTRLFDVVVHSAGLAVDYQAAVVDRLLLCRLGAHY